ncbi:MAG: hypothetical protein OXI38_12240 [Bacteroidota bacterium]|nr:hypothetical protein [Bacteroidota bacterium]
MRRTATRGEHVAGDGESGISFLVFGFHFAGDRIVASAFLFIGVIIIIAATSAGTGIAG